VQLQNPVSLNLGEFDRLAYVLCADVFLAILSMKALF
jgi:hypothetical protein